MNHSHSGTYHKLYNSLQDTGSSHSLQNSSNVSLDNNAQSAINNKSDSRHSSIVELLSLPSSSNINHTDKITNDSKDINKLSEQFGSQLEVSVSNGSSTSSSSQTSLRSMSINSNNNYIQQSPHQQHYSSVLLNKKMSDNNSIPLLHHHTPNPPSLLSKSRSQSYSNPQQTKNLHGGNTDMSLESLEMHHSTSSLFKFQKKEKLIQNSHKQEWSKIKISDLIQEEHLHFVNENISIQDAFFKLQEYNLTSLPVITESKDMNDCLTFDYNDMNAYMLISLNKIRVKKEVNESLYLLTANEPDNGKPVEVGDIIKFVPKTPFLKFSHTESLSRILQILGNGVHRVAITDGTTGPDMKIKGILSQRRLLKYLWDNASKFENFEELSKFKLKDLKIGVLEQPFEKKDLNNKENNKARVIAIEGTKPLIEGLFKMYTNQISSIAVIDSNQMLLGNISVTDIKYLTTFAQYPLLFNTCKNFISYILNKRGLDDGKDSFPIFHVHMHSSLNRCIAKLVATKAHRLWIVDDTVVHPSTPTTDNTPQLAGIGKLIGVVSLSDILGVFVRDSKTSKMEVDPQMARKFRQTEATVSE